MTEHGIRREQGRRVAMVGMVFVVLLIFAGLAVRIGPLLAALCALALPALTFLVIDLALRRIARDGWAASLPLVFAHRLGLPGTGRHGRWSDKQRYERQELLGRIVIDGDVLRWEPREGDRRRGVPPVQWQRPWGAELVPLWGPGRLRCLTLPGPDGEPIDLWIRDPHRTAHRLV